MQDLSTEQCGGPDMRLVGDGNTAKVIYTADDQNTIWIPTWISYINRFVCD